LEKMPMTMFCVAASAPLRPDPDENSPPLSTLDPTEVLTVVRVLDPWSKISLTRVGVTLQGWIVSTDLISIEEGTVRLFDEPLGAQTETATGRIDIVARVATWAKAKVTKADGSVSVGWTEDATHAPDPAKQVGTSAASPGAAPAEAGDLVLGVNERYRAALAQAEAITHIDAAALATLIDAEAAKIRSGADAGVWDPKSSAGASSSASGLTQFLDTTWCDMACRPGSFLNAEARKRGFVSNDNKIAPGMNSALLDLRFDPTQSIVAAAEYGLANLTELQKDKLVAPEIGDDDRAWFIYLAHHEGLQGAEQFLRKEGIVPFSKLLAQVGDPARANALVTAAGGDVTLAYRNWLTGFMEQKIQPSRFRLAKSPGGKAIAQSARALGQFDSGPIALSSLGARPDLVLEIQQTLSNLGYLDPPPDGVMGPTSHWALAEFCKLNGVSLDGGFTNEIARTLLNPKTLLPDIRPVGKWIDRVLSYMHAKNYFVCRHPDCKNIIYVEGLDQDGTLNAQTPNVFEDLRIVFSIGRDGAPVVQDWISTTEPGKTFTMNPMNPLGAARIAFGQFKSWAVGIHKGASGFDPHEALVQVAPIDIYRDAKKDFKREGPVSSGVFGINQHWGFDAPKDNVGNTSAGCLVGETRDGHRAFMALVKSDPRFVANNGYKFMTAILSGRDALSPSSV
jgi:peptidoglycan hydrolase-like protein with peptidoglycan-binding domain